VIEYPREGDALSHVSVTPSPVNQGWVEAMYVVVLAQQHEASPDGVITAIVGLQVVAQFLLRCRTVLVSQYVQILIEYHCFGPLPSLSNRYLILFLQFLGQHCAIELLIHFK
jgi:hypothetical protein